MILSPFTESSRDRSNLGLTEVSGSSVRVAITAETSDHRAATMQLDLRPYGFRQINSLLQQMSLEGTATIRVAVIGGNGKILAYGSMIDRRSGDPTYVPGW